METDVILFFTTKMCQVKYNILSIINDLQPLLVVKYELTSEKTATF